LRGVRVKQKGNALIMGGKGKNPVHRRTKKVNLTQLVMAAKVSEGGGWILESMLQKRIYMEGSN